MNDELYHHGIKGMKWGVRRYQNKDGSYTAAGKKRYSLKAKIDNKIRARKQAKQERKQINSRIKSIDKAQRKRAIEIDINSLNDQQLRNLNDRIRNENSYKDSIRVKRKKIFGARFAKEILGRNGNKILDKVVLASMISLGTVAVGAMFGDKYGKAFYKATSTLNKVKEKAKGN